MLYSLKGRISHVEGNFFVVECGGVGYLCRASATTLSTLPPVGEEAKVYTHLNVTQDGIDLYGFFSRSEQEFFRMLTGVSGVGPKAALALLSEFTPDALALTIAAGDSKTLTKAKGIGPKAAQRVILELHDKMSNEAVIGGFSASAPLLPSGGAAGDAIAAMVALGYTQQEAAAAIGGLSQELSAEEMIKTALKSLAGRR